jgi:hypothetical protein
LTHCVDSIRTAELRPEESARARNDGHVLALSLAVSVSHVFDTACPVFVVGFAGIGISRWAHAQLKTSCRCIDFPHALKALDTNSIAFDNRFFR